MEKDWVVLKIDERRMWVSLAIKEPEGEEASYFSPDFIEAYLKENGIKAGIDKEAIAALSDSVAYGQEVIVARGKPPVKGRDGCYNFTVMLEDVKSKPVVNADGSVDYYNSLKLAMVKKDEIIAVYVPPTSGEYGYTVFSEMLPPMKGRDIKPLRGKGFSVSEDKKEYRALYDGRIYTENERIIIEKLYYVKGDLDIEQGNIKFNGDVEIRGDVRSGLSIEADGSIFIHGHVGACRLIAGGSITIRKGVQGRNKCEIIAKGDIACSFVERCYIKSDANIYADSILDSEIFAKQKVVVSSKKGLIVGGIVTGNQGIFAKEAGNDIGIMTILKTGMVSDYLQRIAELRIQKEKVNRELDLIERNHKAYETLDGSKHTKETEAIRMKLVRAKVVKSTERKQLTDEINLLNEEVENIKKEAVVKISGIAYAGIVIHIKNQEFTVKDSCKEVVFRLRGNEIVATADDKT